MSSLLPPNSTELELALEQLAAARLSAIPIPLRDLKHPDTCPVELLPWLAWEMSVDSWDGLTEAQHRAMIKASALIHRKKGTVASVKAILAASGLEATLIEWWQTTPKGTPHTFTVEVTAEDRALTDATLLRIEQQIISVKPVRSQFTTRLVGLTRCSLSLACATLSGEHTTVLPYQLTLLEAQPGKISIGIGWQEHLTTTIYPEVT